jgi:hypothetical protein
MLGIKLNSKTPTESIESVDSKPKKSSKREKTQPMRLLSYGQASSAPVAITSLASAGFSGLCLLFIFANYGATSAISKYTKGVSLIQLSDGSTALAQFAAPNQRSDTMIRNFVANSTIKLFTWDGILRTEENGKLIESVDKGTEVKTDTSNKRIPTDVWEAAFTLSEEQDFRASFLKKLGDTIPDGILSGKGTVSLITNHVSAPRKMKEGVWEVDIVANLVSFSAERNSSKGIPFNKTITVRAIDVPQNPPKVNDITEKIYKAKIEGLEIVQIIDLDLGKNKK